MDLRRNQLFHLAWLSNRMAAGDPSNFYSPVMYLAGLGLRPLDPQPRNPEMRKSQQQYWFPDNFALYEKCRVLPQEETVDGASCIVVEAERHRESEGKRQLISDRFWFDAKLGFAPRGRSGARTASWQTCGPTPSLRSSRPVARSRGRARGPAARRPGSRQTCAIVRR